MQTGYGLSIDNFEQGHKYGHLHIHSLYSIICPDESGIILEDERQSATRGEHTNKSNPFFCYHLGFHAALRSRSRWVDLNLCYKRQRWQ